MLDLTLLPDGGMGWLDGSGEHADVVLYLVNAAEDPEDAGYWSAEMNILAWMNKPVRNRGNARMLAAGTNTRQPTAITSKPRAMPFLNPVRLRI